MDWPAVLFTGTAGQAFSARYQQLRFFTLALLGRRVVEPVVASVLGPKVAFELLKAIDQLSNKGVAPWVATYLYTLRVFGNIAAQDKLSRHTDLPLFSSVISSHYGLRFHAVLSSGFGGCSSRVIVRQPEETTLLQHTEHNSDERDPSRTMTAITSPGKDGDMVLFDGDLFEYTTNVETVVVNGAISYQRPRK